MLRVAFIIQVEIKLIKLRYFIATRTIVLSVEERMYVCICYQRLAFASCLIPRIGHSLKYTTHTRLLTLRGAGAWYITVRSVHVQK